MSAAKREREAVRLEQLATKNIELAGSERLGNIRVMHTDAASRQRSRAERLRAANQKRSQS